MEGVKQEVEEFAVEAILAKLKNRGRVLYLIHWNGYDDSYNSWEPIENLANSSELIEEYELKLSQMFGPVLPNFRYPKQKFSRISLFSQGLTQIGPENCMLATDANMSMYGYYDFKREEGELLGIVDHYTESPAKYLDEKFSTGFVVKVRERESGNTKLSYANLGELREFHPQMLDRYLRSRNRV